jgi:hypothetical protein
MRIEGLERHSVGDRTRIQARVIYEDVDLPSREVFYEAGPPLAEALEAAPEAFVAAAFPLAVWEGERRLRIEGAVDTTLASGLGQVTRLLAAWYPRCGSLALEPTEGFRVQDPRPEPHTAALYSGGVDATAMLCENRRLVPRGHPQSIRTLVYAFGFTGLDHPDGVEDPFMRARNDAHAERLEATAREVGCELVRLDTNAMRLHPSKKAWYDAAYGAAFLAPLLASPAYVKDALIASTGEGGAVDVPHGSHPMLDGLYSTSAVRTHHAQPHYTRLDKLRMIAEWEPAFDSLQVCFGVRLKDPTVTNCGRCEKCLRTMIGLLACGALERFTALPHDDVTPEMIQAHQPTKSTALYFLHPDLQAALTRRGREDLVRALKAQARRPYDSRWETLRRRWRRSAAKRLGLRPQGQSAR